MDHVAITPPSANIVVTPAAAINIFIFMLGLETLTLLQSCYSRICLLRDKETIKITNNKTINS